MANRRCGGKTKRGREQRRDGERAKLSVNEWKSPAASHPGSLSLARKSRLVLMRRTNPRSIKRNGRCIGGQNAEAIVVSAEALLYSGFCVRADVTTQENYDREVFITILMIIC